MLYSLKPYNSPGKDTHAYCDNLFTKEELNTILALPEWLNTTNGTVGSIENTVNENIRKNNIAWLNVNNNTQFIWEKISEVISNINSKFFQFDLSGFYEPIQLGVYNSDIQSHYNWHADANPNDPRVPRKLSMSLILSDNSEYEGGELQLKSQSDTEIILNCPKGRAWFFPSYTLHRVTPVTRGIRRSLVVWVGGPAFK